MATLTKEQIEQKKKLLDEKLKQARDLHDEPIEAKKQQKEAGASELPDDALEQAAGGAPFPECVAHDMSGIHPTSVL